MINFKTLEHEIILEPKTSMSTEQMQTKADSINWWIKMPFSNGVVTKGQTSVNEILPYLGIPENLSGKRVLDIGCSDGYFSFLAESLGAEVVSIDPLPTRGYQFAHDILNSKAKFHQMEVYDVSPKELGKFDVVFFFGVYYHLKHPTLAMEKVASVTKSLAIAESAVLAEKWAKNLSISKFFEHDRPGNDMTQYWIPTPINFLQNLRSGGFPKVELYSEFFHPQRGNRAVVHGHKTEKTSDKILSDSIVIRVNKPIPDTKLPYGDFSITGWAYDFKFSGDEGIDEVEVYLDNFDEKNLIDGEAEFNLERKDVLSELNISSNPGFIFRGTMPKVNSGSHKFYVCIYSKSGWNYQSIGFRI